MRIVITGAAGFVGGNLSRYLSYQGHGVIPIVRSEDKARAFQGAAFDCRIGDVTDREFLNRAFKDTEVVIHLAALFNNPEASWDEYYRVNVEGTKNVLDAVRECGVQRLIHCSTVGVASAGVLPPYSESTPYAPPDDKYERTKCESEKLVLEYHKKYQLPIVVIRPAQVYGPGDRSKAKFYRMVKKGVIVNPGATLKHLIFIDDLCKAFEMAMLKDSAIGEIFIIAADTPTALKDYVGLVAHELGVPTPKILIPALPMTLLCAITENISNILRVKPPLFRRSMDFFTRSVHFDVSKAKRLLGFLAQTDLRSGIVRTVEWYKQNGYL